MQFQQPNISNFQSVTGRSVDIHHFMPINNYKFWQRRNPSCSKLLLEFSGNPSITASFVDCSPLPVRPLFHRLQQVSMKRFCLRLSLRFDSFWNSSITIQNYTVGNAQRPVSNAQISVLLVHICQWHSQNWLKHTTAIVQHILKYDKNALCMMLSYA
jgi:hypothetical protein